MHRHSGDHRQRAPDIRNLVVVEGVDHREIVVQNIPTRGPTASPSLRATDKVRPIGPVVINPAPRRKALGQSIPLGEASVDPRGGEA